MVFQRKQGIIDNTQQPIDQELFEILRGKPLEEITAGVMDTVVKRMMEDIVAFREICDRLGVGTDALTVQLKRAMVRRLQE